MPEQLPLDFSMSNAERQRLARRRAERAAVKEPSLFDVPPNMDVHLHSPTEAVADFTGSEPDRAMLFLQSLVGPLRVIKARRAAFPTAALDRLLWVRPPAQITLDAAAAAVARGLWAQKLGLRPLLVRRDGRRLLASSFRWPTGLRVVDAPWTAIACLTRLGVRFDVEEGASRLLLDRLADAGTPIATAGLAGSAVLIETSRPDLLTSMDLPGLSYAGDPLSGMFRLPLLAAEPLLSLPQVQLTPDLEREIRSVARPPRPLETPPGFPWTLFGFQARDAGRASRILEVTGGVLLAGEMGSGKALAEETLVLTPDGPRPIGDLSVGDLVFGRDGCAHPVTGVFPQGHRDLFRVSFSNGTAIDADADHLWEVMDDSGRVLVVDTVELALLCLDQRRWYVPLIDAPLTFETTGEVPDAALLEDTYHAGWAAGSGVTDVPETVLRAPSFLRASFLAGVLDARPHPTSAGDGKSFQVSGDSGLIGVVVELVVSLGGVAVESSAPGSCLEVMFPDHLDVPVRTSPVAPVSDRRSPSLRVVAVEPAGVGMAVCISVDAPGSLYLCANGALTHNTTVSLALAAHLDLFPMLVVAPLSAFSTWARQLGEMGRSFYLATEAPARSWERIEDPSLDAVVVSYDRLHAFTEIIDHRAFRVIVADEVQRIRSAGSRRSRALRALASSVPYRIGLSGTPLTNSVNDLLPIGAFLIPGEWRPRANAKDLSDTYPGDPVEAVAEHLGSMMVRRRMVDTGARLPKRNDHRVYVQLSQDQRRALEELEEEARRAKEDGEFADNSSRMHAFARLQRMRQIVNSPAAAGVPGPDPKVTTALELVEDFLSMGRKGVLFCADRATFRLLGERLTEMDIGWVGIWGATPPHERIAAEKRFHSDPDVKVVLCTIQAGSESWSASPTATWLISTSYMYAPATLEQMEARVYRMNSDPDGPDIEILYVHAQAPGGSLDDRMVEIIALKKRLFAQVVDRRHHVDTTQVHLSLGDLVFLLTGERDDALDRRAADEKALREAEAKRKERTRYSLSKFRSGSSGSSDYVHDDGSTAITFEELAERLAGGRLDDDDLFPVIDGGDVDAADLDDSWDAG